MEIHQQIYSAKRFLILRDYETSIKICEEGLEVLEDLHNEDIERVRDVTDDYDVQKAQVAFGVLALQGLTLNGRRNEVDGFVGKWFGCSRSFPAEILLICACHHLQMQSYQSALDLVEDWLYEERNHRNTAIGKVVEMYVRHILLPMKEIEKAENFLEAEFESIPSENKKKLITCVKKMKEETLTSTQLASCQKTNDQASLCIPPSSLNIVNTGTTKMPSRGPVFGFFLKVYRFCTTVTQIMTNASMKTKLKSCVRITVLAFFLYVIILRTYFPGEIFYGRLSGASLMWNAVKQAWRALFAPYHLIQAA